MRCQCILHDRAYNCTLQAQSTKDLQPAICLSREWRLLLPTTVLGMRLSACCRRPTPTPVASPPIPILILPPSPDPTGRAAGDASPPATTTSPAPGTVTTACVPPGTTPTSPPSNIATTASVPTPVPAPAPAPAPTPSPAPPAVNVNDPQQLQHSLSNPGTAVSTATAISQALAAQGNNCGSGIGQAIASELFPAPTCSVTHRHNQVIRIGADRNLDCMTG
jgi:hypothetical protein